MRRTEVTRCAARIEVEEERRKRIVKEDAEVRNPEGWRWAAEGRSRCQGKVRS